MLTALSMTISTIVLAIKGAFRGRGGPPPKDEGVLNKWLNRLAMLSKDLQERLLIHCLLSWEVLLVPF